jgi:ferredoxin-NADP reductase
MPNAVEVDVGTRVTARGSFATVDDTPDDPATVTVKVRNPGGVSTFVYGADAAVVRDALGEYHLDVDTPVAGHYVVRMAGTGGGPIAAKEVSFFVRRSAF